MQTGDYAVLNELPDWVEQLPEESQRVFRLCVGRTYPVIEVDMNGLYILDVSADIDERFGGFMNTVMVEQCYLTKVQRE
jgi:hypothetical protein